MISNERGKKSGHKFTSNKWRTNTRISTSWCWLTGPSKRDLVIWVIGCCESIAAQTINSVGNKCKKKETTTTKSINKPVRWEPHCWHRKYSNFSICLSLRLQKRLCEINKYDNIYKYIIFACPYCIRVRLGVRCCAITINAVGPLSTTIKRTQHPNWDSC